MNLTTKFDSVTVYSSETPNVRWEHPSDGIFHEREGVHIWYLNKKKFSPEELKKLIVVLTPEERAKVERFHFEKDKTRYIITHGILRLLLMQYLDIHPDDVLFEKNQKDKPFLIAYPEVQFNLSYSLDHILLAFRFCKKGKSNYLDHQIGVDVEDVNRSIDIALIIKDYFTFEEQEHILNSTNPASIFFKLWTRKEALVKATGTGLTAQLKNYNLFPPVSKLFLNKQFSSLFYSQKLFIRSFNINVSGIASIAMTENDEPLRFFRY